MWVPCSEHIAAVRRDAAHLTISHGRVFSILLTKQGGPQLTLAAADVHRETVRYKMFTKYIEFPTSHLWILCGTDSKRPPQYARMLGSLLKEY